MAACPSPRSLIDSLGPKVLLLWAGLSIGVAFLATPAKFLAPSLTLPVALDVGRQTFRVYNSAEFILLIGLVVLGLWSSGRRNWYFALAVPAAVIIAQALWLIPALDLRVSAILSGERHLPPSNLHTFYIAAEALKVLWLLVFGLVELIGRPASSPRTESSGSPAGDSGFIQA